MVEFADVRRWQSAPLETAERALKQRCDDLLELSDEMHLAMNPVAWTGEAAEAAAAERKELRERLEFLVAEVGAARTAFIDASDAVRVVQHAVADTDALAGAYGLRIDVDGSVIDPGPPPGTPPDQLASVMHDREQLKADLADRVKTITSHAGSVDAALSKVLSKIEHGEISDGGATSLAAAGQAGAVQASLHDRLLAKYRVAPDPNGMVDVPFTNLKVTATEAQHLADLGMLGAKDAYDMYKTSLVEARGPFNNVGETNGHTDAVRHILWNAQLANRFGSEWTEGYTTAHERKPHSEGVHASEQAMDLHNNEIGRRIAVEHPDASPEELVKYAEEAVRNGDAVVIGSDGKLAHSHEVPVGQNLDRASDPPPMGGPEPQTRWENTPGGYDYGGGYNPGSDPESYGTYDVG